MSALTDLFTAFANKIRSKTGGSDTYTPPQMVNAIDDVYQAGVDAGTTPTQTKTVTAGTTATTVTPDTGYALSSVTVNPTPSQSKSATPSTTAQTITPDSGKLLSSVSVSAIQTQTKSATPSTSAQTITPDSGKYLTSVSVGAISTETKSQAAGTSNIDVTPTSGKYLTKVTITPQQHSETYTPAANKSNNDMGAVHNKRYVNTSGMIVPSGAKSITANGTGIDVSGYATANVNVPNPTLSGDAAVGNVLSGKTFYNSDYTKRTGTMTNNGAVSPTALSAGGSYTVPAGYHNGSGVVSAKDLASQTGVDSGKTAVTAAKMFSGYQGWVNGSKISGTYVEPTINDITPSSTPIELTDGVIYKAHKRVPSTISDSAGYAIEGYSSVTPTASGAQFSQGMVNMSDGGYAYTAKPGKTETTLWTNSSPTSSFAEQTITLSQAFTNFDLIKIEYQASVSKTTKGYVYVDKTTLQQSLWSDASKPLVSISGRNNSASGSTQYVRRIVYVSTTQLTITTAYQINANNSATNSAIPTKITGIKFSGITF